MRQALVRQKDPWAHTVEVAVPEAGGDENHEVTPESGVVIISYYDANGVRRYYDAGTQTFIIGPEIQNATTIAGPESQLPYTHLTETKGRIVTFEGWIVRNGYKTPKKIIEVQVLHKSAAKLEF